MTDEPSDGYYYNFTEILRSLEAELASVSINDEDERFALARALTDECRQATADYRAAIEACEQGHGSLAEVEAMRLLAERLLARARSLNVEVG
jgi:hypothetical protein